MKNFTFILSLSLLAHFSFGQDSNTNSQEDTVEETIYITDPRVTVPDNLDIEGMEEVNNFKNAAYSYMAETLQFQDSVKMLNDKLQAYEANADEVELQEVAVAYVQGTSQSSRGEALLNKGVDLISNSSVLLDGLPVGFHALKGLKMVKNCVKALKAAKKNLTESAKMLPDNVIRLGKILVGRGVKLEDIDTIIENIPSGNSDK